ncbi:MAG: YdeI/OmpD-associated family protein [Pseudomonadota bacterium]
MEVGPAPIRFEAVVAEHDYGRIKYACIYLPDAVAANLPRGARLAGEIARRSWQGGLVAAGQGRFFLLLSARFLKAIGASVGTRVAVALALTDPDEVLVPVPLAEALSEAPDLAAVWEGLSPGARRGWAHRVDSAKREETRMARVSEVLAALESDNPSPYRNRR